MEIKITYTGGLDTELDKKKTKFFKNILKLSIISAIFTKPPNLFILIILSVSRTTKFWYLSKIL